MAHATGDISVVSDPKHVVRVNGETLELALDLHGPAWGLKEVDDATGLVIIVLELARAEGHIAYLVRWQVAGSIDGLLGLLGGFRCGHWLSVGARDVVGGDLGLLGLLWLLSWLLIDGLLVDGLLIDLLLIDRLLISGLSIDNLWLVGYILNLLLRLLASLELRLKATSLEKA